MIWLLMIALAVTLMVPVLLVFGKAGPVNNCRDPAVNLHLAQLDELARDATEGRIAPGEYAEAKLEIERRLLVADGLRDAEQNGNAKMFLIASMILIPLMAFMLYLPGSTPDVPSEPHASWVVQQQQAQAQVSILITQLRAHLSLIDPNSVEASQGQAYLGEALAEQAGQLTPESIALFKQSLATAPASAPWRKLDEQRLAQASVPQ